MTDHGTGHAAHAVAGAGAGSGVASAFEADMNVGMARMMQDMHSPGYTGRPDIDFLAMMIPHHEGAVDMARLVLIHGRDPMVRQIAQDIIASQIVEIAAMHGRMAALQRGPDPQPGGYPALGAVRGGG